MFEFMEKVFPAIVLFLLFRGILQTILGKKGRKPQRELPPDSEDGEDAEPYEAETATDAEPDKGTDLASEFERRLRKRKGEEARNEEPVAAEKTSGGVVVVNADVTTDDEVKQRVHRDNEAHHEGKGRIHRWNEGYKHDKGRVYLDPRGDYSYSEEKMNAAADAFSAAMRKQKVEAAQPKRKLRHRELVNGFIMAQVLDKPRSLKPYDGKQLL